MPRRLALFLAIPLVALFLAATPRAAQAELRLIMFSEVGCVWCEMWRADIGGIYAITPEGKTAPLWEIDINDPYPEGLQLTSTPQYTPTFVLVDGLKEVGRIEGYPGEDFFWWLLGMLLKKAGAPVPGS